MQMDWVSNDRFLQCGTQGSEYHRLHECEARNRTRLELPRDISNRQQSATSTGKMVLGKRYYIESFGKLVTSGKTQSKNNR